MTVLVYQIPWETVSEMIPGTRVRHTSGMAKSSSIAKDEGTHIFAQCARLQAPSHTGTEKGPRVKLQITPDLNDMRKHLEVLQEPVSRAVRLGSYCYERSGSYVRLGRLRIDGLLQDYSYDDQADKVIL